MKETKLPYEGRQVRISRSIAICPYCEGSLYVYVNAWDKPLKGGSWEVSEIELHCRKEKWDDPSDHTYMPYVYWLPVEQIVLGWLNKRLGEKRQKDAKRQTQRRWEKRLEWNCASVPLPNLEIDV